MDHRTIPYTANVRIVSGQFAGKYGRLTGQKMFSTTHNCELLEVEFGRKGRLLLTYVPTFRLDRFTKERNDLIAEFGEYHD